MARISTYIKDTNLNDLDMVIGTDYDNSDATVNFKLESIAEYMRNSFGSTYTFTQATPSSIWTIAHSLEKFPSITVVDSSNNVVVGFSTYDSNNQITLEFSAPFAGKAYLN
jgi:hypothetical protein